MLSRVRIRGLGVIDDAELELGPGLNVITGETGAGKTMVVSGLGLLLGARADSALVRSDAGRASVEGEVDVQPDHPVAIRAAAAGGDVDGGVILVRTVTADGRSRAHVGGRSAPVGTLAEIGELLVAVHGQADQWRLRRAEEHRLLLDQFGGPAVAGAAASYQDAYSQWRTTRQRLERLTQVDADRTRRAEMLRMVLEEVERVDPQPGEEDALRLEESRLAHADGLRDAAERAHACLVGRDDDPSGAAHPPVLSLVGDAVRSLGQAGAHDPALAGLQERVSELTYLLSDVAADLASYVAQVEVDPVRLGSIQARRAELGTVLRKYGPSSADVLSFAQEASRELLEIDGSEEVLARLTEQEAQQRAAVGAAGDALSSVRRHAAATLGERVGEELRHLSMGSAAVQVVVTQRPAADGVPSRDRRVSAWSHGLDDVEIMMQANPGAPARSVARAASGGELSRVMLALEVVCAHGEVPTYVFDEVDAGVGGSAALDLGARLAALAQHAQVVVVTHLGQVAAFADHHLVVRKSTDGQVTSSDVHRVDAEERVAEVARMLGGVADSAAALEHARELLEDHAPHRAVGRSGSARVGP